MKRIHRVESLVLIGVAAGFAALLLVNTYIASVKEDTAKATIAAGVITLFGVIFSAMYNEISAYYRERSASISRKWDLIFPFIKKDYNPWINSANSFLKTVKKLDPKALNDEVVTRVLYLTSVFYGIRLRFIVKDGGLILLSTDEEEKKVDSAYREIENNFVWAEKDKTQRLVSYLQNLFLSKEKPEDPYVLAKFTNDLAKDRTLKESRKELRSWLTEENIKKLGTALENFVNCFKASIDKLYKAWGD